jgi:pimeloyl-ACP methyl ester carboxylesterase
MKNNLSFLILGLFLFTQSALYSASKFDCTEDLSKLVSQGKVKKDLSQNPVELFTSENTFKERGAVYKRWDPELNTSIYSTIAEPRHDGSVPLIPKNAKAIMIFFHGSGTAKSSGKNFIENMNVLRPTGIAGISVDLPFHADNKGSEKLKKMDSFMAWVHQLVEKVKTESKETGKKLPIYMAGHSFGPGVIQEYLERYPNDIEGALLLSPAGDFHPAMKYTYENITVPGEKFMGGEPVIENPEGGDWAGQLDSQFTWQKRPPLKSKTKIQAVIGALDEWWPGNKELAAKVGVSQPYQFDEPLEFLKNKYPNAEFSILPGVGHMLFGANAENGRNLIREKIFDLVGIPESERTPAGVGITPAQKVALLYQSSPVFRDWLGNKYPHSFEDEFRTAGVLREWEKTKFEGWKKILDRLASEHPELALARPFSVALAKEKAHKAGKDTSLDEVSMKLQKDLLTYLAGNPKEKEALLSSRDPETPAPVSIPSNTLQKNWEATKSGAIGPMTRNLFEQQLEKLGASDVTASPAGPQMIRLRYKVKDSSYESVVLDYSPKQLEAKVNDLYLKAFINHHYGNPGENIEIKDEGLVWKFTVKGGKVLALQVTAPK